MQANNYTLHILNYILYTYEQKCGEGVKFGFQKQASNNNNLKTIKMKLLRKLDTIEWVKAIHIETPIDDWIYVLL